MNNPNLSIAFSTLGNYELGDTLNRYLSSVQLMIGAPWWGKKKVSDLTRLAGYAKFSLVALGSGDTNAGAILLKAIIRAQEAKMKARVTFFGETGEFTVENFALSSITGEAKTSNVDFTAVFLLGEHLG